MHTSGKLCRICSVIHFSADYFTLNFRRGYTWWYNSSSGHLHHKMIFFFTNWFPFWYLLPGLVILPNFKHFCSCQLLGTGLAGGLAHSTTTSDYDTCRVVGCVCTPYGSPPTPHPHRDKNLAPIPLLVSEADHNIELLFLSVCLSQWNWPHHWTLVEITVTKVDLGTSCLADSTWYLRKLQAHLLKTLQYFKCCAGL